MDINYLINRQRNIAKAKEIFKDLKVLMLKHNVLVDLETTIGAIIFSQTDPDTISKGIDEFERRLIYAIPKVEGDEVSAEIFLTDELQHEVNTGDISIG